MPGPNLSKSRFMAGRQCERLLWLRVNEPSAPELTTTWRLRDLFEQGHQVGELARRRFPGGVLVDLPHDDPRRETITRQYLAGGAPAIFEATFVADRTYIAIDILLKESDGYTIIEVKSGTAAHEKYILDAALQTHVARRAGLQVRRVELMHLNADYQHPGPLDILTRVDVTGEVEMMIPDVPAWIVEQLKTLGGPQPDVDIGEHCRSPYDCPFQTRCWPATRDGVLRIHGLRYDKRFKLLKDGVATIEQLPRDFRLNDVQDRQRRAIEQDRLIVEPSLGEALQPFTGRLGFLDFETVSRAVPRWNGTSPWQQVGVQFSYHETLPDGNYRHAEYLAAPDTDPREEIVDTLIATTRNADRVVMYTPFEKTQVRMMKEFVPARAAELDALEAKMLDLKMVVHRNVYHPEFGGSFSIKDVLPAMVPGMTYKDTVTIQDGGEASAKLARLLFYAYELSDIERALLKRELLAYCKQDTWAMVKLYEKLVSLA